jgi:hypothetical protein
MGNGESASTATVSNLKAIEVIDAEIQSDDESQSNPDKTSRLPF